MSSISSFALGMGGSDSRGYIGQSIMEREVIPIGDSFSKEISHEAPNKIVSN